MSKRLTFSLAITLPFNTPFSVLLEDAAEISTVTLVSLRKLVYDHDELMQIGIEVINGYRPDPEYTSYCFVSLIGKHPESDGWPIYLVD
jgi:hypothetical protein